MKPEAARDLTGKVFGRLTVVKYNGLRHQARWWECVCICGNTRVLSTKSLRKTRSCGCLRAIRNRERKGSVVTHGMTHSSGYYSWAGMKQRCLCPTSKDYHKYGGRGITIHPEWMDFAVFIKDMGPRPSTRHSIERLKLNGNYEPGNCVWALPKQQANNRRTSHIITYNGITRTLTQWADTLDTTEDVLRRRIYTYNWSVGRALTAPVRKKPRRKLNDS